LAQPAWVTAGGSPWAADPPVDGSAVLTPEAHLRVAIPWVCANLRAVTAHLDAMLVCHVAGCPRVTESRTGIPSAGEAGCDERCAGLVHRYLTAVHDNLTRFAADRGHVPRPPLAAPRLPAGTPAGGPLGPPAPREPKTGPPPAP